MRKGPKDPYLHSLMKMAFRSWMSHTNNANLRLRENPFRWLLRFVHLLGNPKSDLVEWLRTTPAWICKLGHSKGWRSFFGHAWIKFPFFTSSCEWEKKVYHVLLPIWQYWLSSFQERDTRSDRFWANYQYFLMTLAVKKYSNLTIKVNF